MNELTLLGMFETFIIGLASGALIGTAFYWHDDLSMLLFNGILGLLTLSTLLGIYS